MSRVGQSGAYRDEPLHCGYIGDFTSGGLVLHDENPGSSAVGFGGAITLDLGYGIPRDRALALAGKLDSVLREIHEAQGRYR